MADEATMAPDGTAVRVALWRAMHVQAAHGVAQYVLLGAGLDTFAQRRPDLAAGLTVFRACGPGRRPGNDGA